MSEEQAVQAIEKVFGVSGEWLPDFGAAYYTAALTLNGKRYTLVLQEELE